MDSRLMTLLAIGTLFTLYWLLRHQEVLRIRWPGALALAVVHTIVGVACVKIFAVLETLDFGNAGNMSLFGAIFFLPVFYWSGTKLSGRKLAAVFDIFTPCMVFTLLCARVNCLFAGCCLGLTIPGSGLRYPTRELEILFYIIILSWVLWKDRKEKIPGSFYPVYMIAYGAVRFVLEWFRQSDSPAAVHISHLWALITFCLGLSIYMEMRRLYIRRKKRA